MEREQVHEETDWEKVEVNSVNFPNLHLQMPRPYNDVVLSITASTTPDPYVVLHEGTYYMTFTTGSNITIWSSDSLLSLEPRSLKTTIWTPPPNTPYSGDLWAPELHALDGNWYIYFAADDPRTQHPNHSHRIYVLRGPPTTLSPLDPQSWTFHGGLTNMPDEQWAIDGTVITLSSKNYFIYSGWPYGVLHNESRQELYIAEMASPTSLVPNHLPTCISTPSHSWEFSGRSGINEGPQFLSSPYPQHPWTGIVFSCAGSWTSEYKMATLKYLGGNPLNQTSWEKSRKPLLTAPKSGRPPYGPGHGNFVNVPGEGGGITETWAVFHATDGRTGWEGRRARVMRVGWNEHGPYMGCGECGAVAEEIDGFLYGVRKSETQVKMERRRSKSVKGFLVGNVRKGLGLVRGVLK
ncbi:glycoside hydrolase family 43 protein [Sporormia fimetaria CBS 119925]|uniref:Glycoside hydrolase family 43 protein n=1 Tax=Sporormia fimetaria CBS 119925 TaxID=1340428 RepID=A0A6A6VDU8_9PLEO|nr:glycoside hydrolase family 43 protein [Sporormia fimetaria CBS 119925]